LTRPLLPDRKVWKNSKGVSGIIAAIFLVLIVFFLYANVFTFILIQNTSFQEVVSEVNQRDIDRSIEKLTVSNVNYTVVGDQVRVEAQVKNDGPVSVQIVTLWVIDTTTQKYGYNDALNINMKSGDNLVFTGSNALAVTIEDSNPLDVFTSWFVTDRGNLIPLEKEKGIIVAQLAQGIGSISMDFKQFMYYEFTSSPTNGTVLGIPKKSFTIYSGNYTILACLLTNLDPSGQAVNLTTNSYIWAVTAHAETVKADHWDIAKVVDNKYISTFDFQVLPYGVPTWVYFGPWKPKWCRGVVPVFILLSGRLETSDYGQNIPFIAFNIT